MERKSTGRDVLTTAPAREAEQVEHHPKVGDRRVRIERRPRSIFDRIAASIRRLLPT